MDICSILECMLRIIAAILPIVIHNAYSGNKASKRSKCSRRK
jgi:hypothetical protein